MQLPKVVRRTGRKFLSISATLLVAVTGSAAAQRGVGGYGSGMMNDGWGMSGGWGFLWLLVLVGLAILVVAAVRGKNQSQRSDQPDRALAELRERYARGEIDEGEFEKRRQILREER